MNYIYFSSGLFGAKILPQLEPKPTLVITQADRLGGRGMQTKIATQAKIAAKELKIPVQQIHNNLALFDLNLLKKISFALVADFGLIIPKKLLYIPKYGFWNIHPSLLPKYRGPTPIQTALLNGEKETGVTIIQMDEQIDHGPILAQEKITVDINDTYSSLLIKLAAKAIFLFNKLSQNPQLATSNKTIQNHSLASYTQKLCKQDGFVPLPQIVTYLQPLFKKYNLLHLIANIQPPTTNTNGLKLHNKIRALNPWPGVWTTLNNSKILKILDSFYNTDNKQLIVNKIKIENKIYKLP